MTGDKLSMTQNEFQDKMRIIQELVPGKQVTLAHIIANNGVDHSWFKNNITFFNLGFALQFGR